MTSRKPAPRRFKKWITSEVIPTIRKTGTYSIHPAQQYPSLRAEDRRVFGGITKRRIASQIRPLLQAREIDHANIVELKRQIEAGKARRRLSSPCPRRSFSVHAGQDRKRGLIDAEAAAWRGE
jgi:prophage antirepressor-like protein